MERRLRHPPLGEDEEPDYGLAVCTGKHAQSRLSVLPSQISFFLQTRAMPVVEMKRDTQRFLCSFQVDADRRLVVSVEDRLTSRVLFEDHPVVRL